MFPLKTKLYNFIVFPFLFLRKIDVRDVLFFGGIFSLWYGLYLKEPWVSFSVCGGILIVSGYIMGDKK